MDRDGQNITLFDNVLEGQTWRNTYDSQELFWSDSDDDDNDNFIEQFISSNAEIITIESDSDVAECKIKVVQVHEDQENWPDFEIEVEPSISGPTT